MELLASRREGPARVNRTGRVLQANRAAPAGVEAFSIAEIVRAAAATVAAEGIIVTGRFASAAVVVKGALASRLVVVELLASLCSRAAGEFEIEKP